ncbi:MAG: DUF4260 domain-containing protein [Sandaracinaceae bacterium]
MTDTTTTTSMDLTTGDALARGGARVLLRIEGLAAMSAAVIGFHFLGGSWAIFAALFLVPDLSLLGYRAGPRVGAILYNAGHSLIGPALLAAGALAFGAPTLVLGALVWVAHIGFDRALGYGLKHTDAFTSTHLGRIGRAKADAAQPAALRRAAM